MKKSQLDSIANSCEEGHISFRDALELAYNLDRDECIPYAYGKNTPKTQGDGLEYLIHGQKATNPKHIDYVVCWFDGGKFYESHGNMREYEDNADLMFITHWMPLPKPPIS